MTTPTKKSPGPATVAMVEEAAAQGRVREIYDDIKATKKIDFVPNLWKTLATHPPLLEQIWTRLKVTMAPGPSRPADQGDDRPGGVGHQWLRLLCELAHGRGQKAGAGRRRARRAHGRRGDVQLDQRLGRWLSGRTGYPSLSASARGHLRALRRCSANTPRFFFLVSRFLPSYAVVAVLASYAGRVVRFEMPFRSKLLPSSPIRPRSRSLSFDC